MKRLLELGGKRVPFLRWSFLRMVLGMRHVTTEWQVGDGREEALAEHVLAHARAGDADDVIRAIDDFGYHRSFLMNVGDEKGAILDRAIRSAEPRQLLELGTYCGYSALRTARVMPAQARLISIEFNAANAEIARRILDHAGIGDRVTVVVGTLGDGGPTIARLEAEHGFGPGSLDFVFIDHDKAAYLPDLQTIVGRDWLHPGSVVVADNVKFPEWRGTAPSCASRRAEAGARSSTTRTWSTSRCSRTWCSNRCISGPRRKGLAAHDARVSHASDNLLVRKRRICQRNVNPPVGEPASAGSRVPGRPPYCSF